VKIGTGTNGKENVKEMGKTLVNVIRRTVLHKWGPDGGQVLSLHEVKGSTLDVLSLNYRGVIGSLDRKKGGGEKNLEAEIVSKRRRKKRRGERNIAF